MKKEQISAFMDRAIAEWRESNKKVVGFTWKGKRYKVSHLGFRYVTHDMKGNPVACKWGWD